ncbi:uncharacterized protein [Medicago truncatula]|uniref:uncharacterized protein n=1 Tax=Medicago truncatula TaxID=3880 RepID=UPI001966FE27|nr:uncharacterized protein LOC25481232 [Medicago truncatula]
MATSTLFIALQCFNCSTMQKQSVRKIFAQGYKAKDIRSFVQSVNMSRKSIEEDDQQQWLLAGTLNPTPEEHVRGEYEFPADLTDKKKCKTDWSLYLDNDDHRATERDGQQQHDWHVSDTPWICSVNIAELVHFHSFRLLSF